MFIHFEKSAAAVVVRRRRNSRQRAVAARGKTARRDIKHVLRRWHRGRP